MHKNPSNLQEVRDNLSEACYTAWIDKSFVPRAVVVVNGMGKIISSVAVGLKAAELNKETYRDPMLRNVTPQTPLIEFPKDAKKK